MIFDTHAHYDDSAFDEDRTELLSHMKENGIGRIVNVASDCKSLMSTWKLTQEYPFLYGALGIHPNETAEITESDMDWIQRKAKEEKIVAIGEIGLDYYWKEPEPEIQKKWFIRQLELAKACHLPVIIHSRDAAADTIEILRENHAEEIGGVLHCFSYSPKIAEEVLAMGFYIGVGGVVTFKNAKKIVEVVKQTPLERIVLETDCPYLAPVPFRGKRNCSFHLPIVSAAIADIKGVTAQEVEAVTWENARILYKMKEE